MTDLTDKIAQTLWSADDDATEPSWGFVTMEQRGKYRHQAKTVIALGAGISRVHVIGEGRPTEFWADEWKLLLQDEGQTLKIIGWGDGDKGKRRRAKQLVADLRSDEWYADA